MQMYIDGNIVHKTDNTPSVVQWYKISKSSSLETPKVLKVVGQTISLEYINDNTDIDCEVVTRQLESNKTICTMRYQIFQLILIE